MKAPVAVAAAVVAAALALTAGPAAAAPTRPWQLGVTGGFRAGGGATVGEVRAFAGYTRYLAASPGHALFVAPGLVLATGGVGFDDPRGVDGHVTADRSSYGLALRAGAAWGPDTWPRVYGYLGAALVHIDARTDSTHLAEAGGATGLQLTLGIAAPAIQQKAFAGQSDEDELVALLSLLLPNTAELTLEEVPGGGATRVGLAVGYSL